MSDYQRIAEAISFIRSHTTQQPQLELVAKQVGLSPYHFQRLFKRLAGVSPKRFLQYLTAEQAKQLLKQSRTVLDTSFAVGLSSPGRLHDLMINIDAMTPGEYKSGGENLHIFYGRHPTPFGDCLLALTRRGICRLEFIDPTAENIIIEKLHEEWPHAHIERQPERTKQSVQQIFYPADSGDDKPLTLLLQGTNFQLKVWQALLNIPPGCVTSYGELAQKIGHTGSGRAVGTALGNNPIGYLIPCHRVLRGDGTIGGYRWGEERKYALLGYELDAE